MSLYSVMFSKVDSAFEGTTQLNFSLDTGPGNEIEGPESGVVIRFRGDEIAPELTLAETSLTISAQGPLTGENNSQELVDYIATITVSDNKDELTTDDINALYYQCGWRAC